MSNFELLRKLFASNLDDDTVKYIYGNLSQTKTTPEPTPTPEPAPEPVPEPVAHTEIDYDKLADIMIAKQQASNRASASIPEQKELSFMDVLGGFLNE